MPIPSSVAGRRIAFVVLALAAACSRISPAPHAGPATALATREVRQFVDSLRRSLSIPAMSATIVHDGRVVFNEGLGLADVERGIAATGTTKFRVGSVSKLFTAAALMLLVEERVVGLDDPVRRYVTPYPPHWPEITLRQLATHSAGIRHYRGAEFFSRTAYPSLRDAIRIFEGDSLLFAPGARYAYSSYGYNLLGAVMESAVGEPFPVLVERLVAKPLGMSATVADSADRPIPGRAVLYRVSAEGVGVTPEDDLSSRWPSGGYLSSTEDLARFGSALTEAGFLSREALRVMLAPLILANGDTVRVGIGWRLGVDSAGREYMHHGGSSNGGSAFLLVYPRERLVVAMAANAFANWGEPQAMRLASLVLE